MKINSLLNTWKSINMSSHFIDENQFSQNSRTQNDFTAFFFFGEFVDIEQSLLFFWRSLVHDWSIFHSLNDFRQKIYVFRSNRYANRNEKIESLDLMKNHHKIIHLMLILSKRKVFISRRQCDFISSALLCQRYAFPN